jgi:hypothetical protein
MGGRPVAKRARKASPSRTAALENTNQLLRERLDAIRQAVGEAARRLEMGAALELEHSKFGLPGHLLNRRHDPSVAESIAWKCNAAAVTTWLRGEAETLHRLGDGIE